MQSAGVTIKPPYAVLATFVIGVLLHLLSPLSYSGAWLPPLLGMIGVFGGIYIMWLCLNLFKQYNTPLPPDQPVHALIETGPYQYSRNPIYLSFLLIYGGIAITVGSVWMTLMMLPLFVYLRYYVIAREEAYLEQRFGDDYLTYSLRVGRWF